MPVKVQCGRVLGNQGIGNSAILYNCVLSHQPEHLLHIASWVLLPSASFFLLLFLSRSHCFDNHPLSFVGKENLSLPEHLRCLASGFGVPEAQQSIHTCCYSPDILIPFGPVQQAFIELLPCAYVCIHLWRAQRSFSNIPHLF